MPPSQPDLFGNADVIPMHIQIEADFNKLLDDLEVFKPRDRSERDRLTQIIKTDIEKAHYIFLQTIAKP